MYLWGASKLIRETFSSFPKKEEGQKVPKCLTSTYLKNGEQQAQPHWMLFHMGKKKMHLCNLKKLSDYFKYSCKWRKLVKAPLRFWTCVFACSSLASSLSHPEPEETKPPQTETMCDYTEGGRKWSQRGWRERRRVVSKKERERERDGRGTKELENEGRTGKGTGWKKKKKAGRRRVHVFCWKSVLWPRLIANKCLDIVVWAPWISVALAYTRQENSFCAHTPTHIHVKANPYLAPARSLPANLDYQL